MPSLESDSYLSQGSVTSFHHFPFHLLNPGFLLGVPSHPSRPHQSHLLHRRIHLHLRWRDTSMTSQSGTQSRFQIFTNALNNPSRFPHLHRGQQRQSKTRGWNVDEKAHFICNHTARTAAPAASLHHIDVTCFLYCQPGVWQVRWFVSPKPPFKGWVSKMRAMMRSRCGVFPCR